MNLDEAPAHAAQLADLLQSVLKLGGHLDSPPADVGALIKAAQGAVAAGGKADELPVIVVQLRGGTIEQSIGTHPARIIFLDDDIEGLDRNQVTYVSGEDQYVTDGLLNVKPSAVADVLEEMAAHVPEEEDEPLEPDGLRP